MKNSLISRLKKIPLIFFIYYRIYMPLRLKYINRTRRIYKKNHKLFINKYGLEIGGPSEIFRNGGSIPLYDTVANLENVNFSDKTFWGEVGFGKNFIYNTNKSNGNQYISDATDLSMIKGDTYDFLLSSHVLEHIANPIKALFEWKRVIKKDGYILIILPSMRHTFDHKRKLTELDHLIFDYNNNTKEDDNTHFDEIIELHNVDKDSTVSSYKEHINRTINNYNTRIAHHHTFDMQLLVSLLEYCAFDVLDCQFIEPYNLVVIAKKI